MMFRIAKQFSLSAAHSLPHLPKGHKCRRQHGHNYTVEVVCEVERLDERGFAGLDYSEFQPVRDYIDKVLDHRDLNEVIQPSTVEVLAQHLWVTAGKLLPKGMRVVCVRVCEVPGTWVEYWQ